MRQTQAQPLPASRRKDIKYIFDHYASGKDSLHASGLLQFLQRDQVESEANDAMAENLIDKYEIDETEQKNRMMTFNGFLRYMESKDCCVLNQEHTRVYQDMGHPLSHYFISSSHNTYLTSDQLVGKSHLFAYKSALRKGCRCLEIDCWDGPDLEPIVYHGYTLTSKILFRDVISTIAEHAFQVSPYPVILSLENHCHPPQQQVMAHYITTILGDKLLNASLDLSSSTELPSPQELQYKILIKNKKLSSRQETEQSVERDRKRVEVDEGEERQVKEQTEESEAGDEEGEDEGEEDSEEEDYSEEDEEEQLPEESKSSTSKGSRKKKGKVKVAVELSNLVIYTKSVKFVSFSHSRDSQNFYENTSLGEKKARKLALKSGYFCTYR
ncbi:hypothetical protein SKAU_G00025120 [Synaphobranchus kaupii]|uniref:Phosphoinositide phospholipase C n=1 Tax=Synaphobranchus kaupii TaxID=118154 RepID=A0A9Q1JF32_SYNKA|nr:hypothetical protein SKAU_G00025120 [Synaphobranchus kaupii]